MLIYKSDLDKFRQDVIHNRIADIMKENFESVFGWHVNPAEHQSWGNSCQHVRNVLDLAGLKDNMICMEYEVPYNTGRIDCMLFGKGLDGKSYIVLLELKQWSHVEEIDDEENYQVETFTGGGFRKVPHPSQQVGGYHNHLLSFVQIFETNAEFGLNSSSYCHNYQKIPGQGLFADRYTKIIEEFPVYTKADVEVLADKLRRLLSEGNGFEIFNRFMQSPIKPSKKLLENASLIIEENQAVFSLLNEQLVAKNVIMSKVRLADKKGIKSVIVVHGGPGTGKTVIAINVLAELAKKKKTVFYGCKSKPFGDALKSIVGPKSRILFSNLTRFVPSKVKENEFDVVLIDEAHRIGKTSNSQYTPREDRTDMPQIDQLIRCAKTAVFFIDDAQNVRSQEVGSSTLIRETAEKFKAGYEDVQLISQFRCAGSDNYLDWLEYVLGYKEKVVDSSIDDRFEFKIFDNPNVLYEVIKQQEAKKANSARLVAGFCWLWSKTLNKDGSLIKDVVIPEHNFAMPWEAQDSYEGGQSLQKGIPKWFQWAYNTTGVEQVGCIYTVQGFEFDYIGVIIGPDLKYDKIKDCLVCDVKATCDPTLKRDAENFETYAKNIYRVLMSRGMKGCYVYFVDKEVEKYFRSRMEKPEEAFIDQIEKEINENLKYVEYLPLYSLEAACGKFNNKRDVKPKGWIKVRSKSWGKDAFVVHAVGNSMCPKISDGDLCIFKAYPVGPYTGQGRTYLFEYQGDPDPDTGGPYTIKDYRSKKGPDGLNTHVELVPRNKSYKVMVFKAEDEDNTSKVVFVAEFIEVLR